MWITIVDGPKPLWVNDHDCHPVDESGEPLLKFPQDTSAPSWFGAPEGSYLRASQILNFAGVLRYESRCSRSKAGSILEFYRSCVEHGGLKIAENSLLEPKERTEKSRYVIFGFSAESQTEHLSMHGLEYKDFTYWTVQCSSKGPQLKRLRNIQFEFTAQVAERIILRDPESKKEYWAAVSCVKETEPWTELRGSRRERELITWSLFPDWAQFTLETGSQGEIHRGKDENGEENWTASIHTLSEGCPRCHFELALDQLGNLGFDATGFDKPNRSYYVVVLQRGHSLELHANAESGDSASLTELDTLGTHTCFARYIPPRGSPLPTGYKSSG
jgi:hypothetical protein